MAGAEQSERDPAVEAFVRHWSLMRLESPLQLMERFDGASKQLISVAGVLQGLYIAAYAFGDRLDGAPIWLGALLITPLLAVIFFAARCVCEVPPGAEAMSAFRQLKTEALAGRDLEQLEAEMDRWCQTVDAVAAKKRTYLHTANWSFVIATAAALVAMVLLMWTHDGGGLSSEAVTPRPPA